MRIILFLSDAMIPLLLFYIVGYGILNRQNVYEDFIEGAKDGLQTVVHIMPTMIGLMVGVGILNGSGLLTQIAKILGMLTNQIAFPAELLPVAIVKMFSSSAATGLVIDIFKRYGTDSRNGLITSLMMSSSETIFYTMSVYFMTAHVKKKSLDTCRCSFGNTCRNHCECFTCRCNAGIKSNVIEKKCGYVHMWQEEGVEAWKNYH